jgi:hypothetical protein
MKIIQSFAQFKEGSVYSKNKAVYLNFYSFLLSYLTLNKYYGHVTMICNKDAYDNFIKFIPYDEIIFMENKNSFDYWSVYKIDALRLIGEDVIHVDSDVFIFDDLFRPFIDGNFDVIVQSIDNNNCITTEYVKHNVEFLNDSGIIDAKIYDKGFASCGVLGIKNKVHADYFDAVDKTYVAMKNNQIKYIEKKWYPMILEESTLYLTILNNKYSVHGILPSEIINQIGVETTGDVSKYTHVWFTTKLDAHNIDLMKRKIRNEFPYYRSLIDKFEMERIDK